jgi:hypothetical protein
MDEPAFKQRSDRLLEIAKVLEKLPAEVRQDAFALLKAYVSGIHDTPTKPDSKANAEATETIATDDREAFFGKFDTAKPADNVKLIAAHWYSNYGVAPFTVDGLIAIANDVGLTVPTRMDMTLQAALNEGKLMFVRAGRGQWKPTVHGEAYLKKTYSVGKGKQSPPEAKE